MAEPNIDRTQVSDAELDVDTVPLSPEEEAMIAESDAELARGGGITTEELRAHLGLPAGR